MSAQQPLPGVSRAASSRAFDRDAFAERVHARMRKHRSDISVAQILEVLKDLDLDGDVGDGGVAAPRLCIRRLRFDGTKTLRDEAPRPVAFDQPFSDGVNVLLIEQNTVGKSSVLKTILFALTGSRDAYDADVRTWIRRIWLTFSIGEVAFTVTIESAEHVRGVLVVGASEASLDTIVARGDFLFHADSVGGLGDELEKFFFERLGLVELRWVTGQSGGSVTESRTSWLTYAQAFYFDADATDYLLCDAAHAYGNQEGLIFSAYLGLRFAEAINRLGVEKSKKTREDKVADEDVTTIRADIEREEALLLRAREELATLDAAIRARQRAVRGPSFAGELGVAQTALLEHHAERQALDEQRQIESGEIRRARARLLRLDEAISMRLHLSGIDVTLCPNCEHDVPQEAIAEEKNTHKCRLCGTPATDADEAHVVGLEAQRTALAADVETRERSRDNLSRRISDTATLIATLAARSVAVQRMAADGVTQALPTEDEDAKREVLFERIGSARAALKAAREKLTGQASRGDDIKLHSYLIEKVREALAEEADARNSSKLARLAALTERFATAIGTESISDVTCSALGRVQLRKHGKPVSFTGIKNPGERLRVKMAFFLALAELGREPEGAHHPGLLLVDQPGSSEMVPTDFASFASVLRSVDTERSGSVQILCFTARPELRAATTPEKVYGAQAGEHAF
jgi:hypothetical protein